jgi:Rod binding domain-containing protein
MSGIPPVGGSPLHEIPELRKAARALEGVFLNQLFQAMRATVPESSLLGSSSGQQMFQSMFDEHMSEVMAQQSEDSLGDLLYDQLRRRVHEMSVDPNR